MKMSKIKKIPLRAYFVFILAILLGLVSAFLIWRHVTNYTFTKGIEENEFDTEMEAKLLKHNFPESYVPYYNLGEAAYKRADYNAAITYFKNALEMEPSKDRDCATRINLALSYCESIDFKSIDSQEKIDTALFILYKARDVLLENGCAAEDPADSHDKDAQQLKEDIDKMIEMLQNPDSYTPPPQQEEQQQQTEPEEDESGSGGKGSSDKEKKIQDQIEQNKKDSMEDRKDQQSGMENYGYEDPMQGGDEDSEGQGSEGDESEGSGSGEGDNSLGGDGNGSGSQGAYKPW